MRPARKPVPAMPWASSPARTEATEGSLTLLRVFLEPVPTAFRVQPNERASLLVLSFFAVRAAPALSAPSPVEFAIRSRARSRFLVSGLYVGRAIGKTAISLAQTTRTTRSTRV